MHSLLDNYLAEVAAQLAPLPPARRDEELRELRQHLINTVVVNQEIGQSEDEALRNAIKQFGTPAALGENVTWAWRRGDRRESRRSFWGAALSMTVLSLLGQVLINPLLTHYLRSDVNNQHPWIVFFAVYLAFAEVMALAGAISGFAFPKRAVAGAKFALTAGLGFGCCQAVFKCVYEGRADYLYAIPMLLLSAAIFMPAALLSARAGSCWRERHAPNARS